MQISKTITTAPAPTIITSGVIEGPDFLEDLPNNAGRRYFALFYDQNGDRIPATDYSVAWSVAAPAEISGTGLNQLGHSAQPAQAHYADVFLGDVQTYGEALELTATATLNA